MSLDIFFTPSFIKSVKQKIVPASLTFSAWSLTGTMALSTASVDDSQLWEAMLNHLATYAVVISRGRDREVLCGEGRRVCFMLKDISASSEGSGVFG
jgi:hypothetical protein